MPTVPTSPGQSPVPSQAVPSDATLLMALAAMHQQGRFDPSRFQTRDNNIIQIPNKRFNTKDSPDIDPRSVPQRPVEASV